MKNRLMPLTDKLLLRKRAIMETIIDHRSTQEYLANRAHPPPQLPELLSQPSVQADRLSSPNQEAVLGLGRGPAAGGGLTRTDVMIGCRRRRAIYVLAAMAHDHAISRMAACGQGCRAVRGLYALEIPKPLDLERCARKRKNQLLVCRDGHQAQSSAQ
jgi:hypothetical protein